MSVEYNAKYLFRKPDLNDLTKQFAAGQPAVEIQSAEKAALLFTRGSIRGVSVYDEEKGLRIRVNHFASQADADLVRAFLGLLLEKGMSVKHESGERLRSGDLTEQRFNEELVSDIGLFDALLINKGEEYLSLPLWDADVILWRIHYEQLREDPEAVRTYLQERAWRLFHSHRASSFSLEKKLRMAVWSYLDTIIQPVDAIAVSNPDENVKEVLIVRWEDFTALDGIHYEKVPRGKEDFYYWVQAIPAGAQSAAFEACRTVAFDPKQTT